MSSPMRPGSMAWDLGGGGSCSRGETRSEGVGLSGLGGFGDDSERKNWW